LVAVAGALATVLLVPPAARAATPTVTEFDDGTANQGTQYGITAASDGKIWFTSYGVHDSLFEIDPLATSPSAIERSVGAPVNAWQPWWVAGGPDGRVYFSSNLGNSFGSMETATGAAQDTFYGGGNPAHPFAFTTGPDGNFWAAELRDGTPTGLGSPDKIGINAPGFPPTVGAGTPTNLTGNSGNADPTGIAVGQGDQVNNSGPSLWVAEFSGNRIARLIPASVGGPTFGILKEYSTHPAGSQPYAITRGPDGNMWFTEIGTNKIGRFAPPVNPNDGLSIQRFDLPLAGQPQAIVAGPDGNMWITQTGGAAIFRMNLAGQVTGTFTTPSNSPNNIVPGPDGNLWYTTYDGNMVGRITTALDPPAFRNTSPITIPVVGAPSTPATVNVSGLPSTVTDVNVRLTGISHTFPDDVDVILQGPQGQTALITSDVGSAVSSQTVGTKRSYPANGITLTLDDQAARPIPDTLPLVSGIYQPTNVIDPNESTLEGNAPGPFSETFPSSLSAFSGTNPNGAWKLWVNDDQSGDSGKIFGGWGLDITATEPPQQQATPTGQRAAALKKCKKKRTAKAKKKCKKKANALPV